MASGDHVSEDGEGLPGPKQACKVWSTWLGRDIFLADCHVAESEVPRGRLEVGGGGDGSSDFCQGPVVPSFLQMVKVLQRVMAARNDRSEAELDYMDASSPEVPI